MRKGVKFVNCGEVVRRDDGAAEIALLDGDEVCRFVITRDNLVRLLKDEISVPVGRIGAVEIPSYGRAALSRPDAMGVRKGIVFRVDCFPGRTFTVARKALEHVLDGEWSCANIAEIIDTIADEPDAAVVFDVGGLPVHLILPKHDAALVTMPRWLNQILRTGR